MDSIYPSLHCMHIELVRCVKVCSISICVRLSRIFKFKCTLELLRIKELVSSYRADTCFCHRIEASLINTKIYTVCPGSN